MIKSTIPLNREIRQSENKKDIFLMIIQFLAAFLVFVLVLNSNGELPTGLIIDNSKVIKYTNIWIGGIFNIAAGLFAICIIHYARKVKRKELFGLKTKSLNSL